MTEQEYQSSAGRVLVDAMNAISEFQGITMAHVLDATERYRAIEAASKAGADLFELLRDVLKEKITTK